VVTADSWASGLDALRRQPFDALLADLADPSLLDGLRALHQAQGILAAVPDGLALVDFDLRVCWANPTFQSWCEAPAVGQGVYEALGASPADGPEFCPFHTALAGPGRVSTRLVCRSGRHLELHVTPVRDLAQASPAPRPLFIALGHDVTALVHQQQKLDALHKAGRELTAAARGDAPGSVADRVELLKHNIRRLTRDLLQYEVIEIRLLGPGGRLEPLLQDGMTPEAASRVLYARPEGNGVTGFVAATGRSYLCPDTQADPLYIQGASGAHSSLTVPLFYQDTLQGTFNVESQGPNHFGEDDLQFAEIFSHAVAAALNTLELLSAEKTFGVSDAIEHVNREVALPVDEILADATSVLDRYIGHDPDLADRIRKIVANARLIKQSIQKVGEDIAPGEPLVKREPPPPPPFKGLRVLVADNDDRVRRSAHGLLGRWGCVVETARDGHEALTMARLSTYDAIVADIRLPDVSGYDVYKGLRQAQPQARVILMTGYGYDAGHSLVKARQDGLKHVLFKPFRVDQLRAALQGLGERS
jgi:CheY-like chemotaxis protein